MLEMRWLIPLAGAIIAYSLTLYMGFLIWVKLGLPVGPYNMLLTLIGLYISIIGLKVMRRVVGLQGGARQYFDSEVKTIEYFINKIDTSAENNKARNRRKITLITTGPYAITRHPAYSGALLTTMGLALILGFPIASIPILYAWLYLVTIIEEAELEEKASEYRDYKSKTPRLAPIRLLIVETLDIIRRLGIHV